MSSAIIFVAPERLIDFWLDVNALNDIIVGLMQRKRFKIEALSCQKYQLFIFCAICGFDFYF